MIRLTKYFPKAQFKPQCPYRVMVGNQTYDTQWHLIAKLNEGIVCEVLSDAPKAFTVPESKYDLVPGINPSFDINKFDSQIVQKNTMSNAIQFVIVTQDNKEHRFDLNSGFLGFFRQGPICLTTSHFLNLGSLGGLHWWKTAYKDKPGFEIILNWSNGCIPEQADIYFKRFYIDGVETFRELPYDDSEGEHILPQRRELSRRYKCITAFNAFDDVVTDFGDGGYFPQGVHVHEAKDTLNYSEFWEKGETTWGMSQVDPLWPTFGVPYGGMTSGQEIFETYMPEMVLNWNEVTRRNVLSQQHMYRCRQFGCIYEEDGRPFDEISHYENGQKTWNMSNNVLKKNEQGPFKWDEKVSSGNCAYEADLKNFQAIHLSHGIRQYNANKVLAWVENDPLARHYIDLDAALGVSQLDNELPEKPNLGANAGRAYAWTMDIALCSKALQSPFKHVTARVEDWIKFHVTYYSQIIMPNGLVIAENQSKEAKQPPMGDGVNAFYFVGQPWQNQLVCHALWGVWKTMGDETAKELVKKLALGTTNFAWKKGFGTTYYKYACGPNDNTDTRYTFQQEADTSLWEVTGTTDWYLPNILAYGFEANAPGMFEKFLEWAKADTPLGAYNNMLQKMNTYSGSQNFHNWSALLGFVAKALGV